MRVHTGLIVYRGKAYLPTFAAWQGEGRGGYTLIAPVEEMPLTVESIEAALRKSSGTANPQIPMPTVAAQEQHAKRGPVLEAIRARSWRELALHGASYSISWMDDKITVDMSELDRKGRFIYTDKKFRVFPPNTDPRVLAEVIVADARSRPEVWE